MRLSLHAHARPRPPLQRLSGLAVLLLFALLPVLFTSCAPSPRRSGSTSRTVATTAASAPLVPTTSTPTTAPPFYVVKTETVAGLGPILVTGQGFTLYMFEPDARSGKSTCSSDCENRWPPDLLVDGITAPKAGPGVNPSLLGVTQRADDPVQVVYNGWPLYRWYGDMQPGETNGQGLDDSGGRWYVLSPEGTPITTRQ